MKREQEVTRQLEDITMGMRQGRNTPGLRPGPGPRPDPKAGLKEINRFPKCWDEGEIARNTAGQLLTSHGLFSQRVHHIFRGL